MTTKLPRYLKALTPQILRRYFFHIALLEARGCAVACGQSEMPLGTADPFGTAATMAPGILRLPDRRRQAPQQRRPRLPGPAATECPAHPLGGGMPVRDRHVLLSRGDVPHDLTGDQCRCVGNQLRLRTFACRVRILASAAGQCLAGGLLRHLKSPQGGLGKAQAQLQCLGQDDARPEPLELGAAVVVVGTRQHERLG